MTTQDIINQRLLNQNLSKNVIKTSSEMVSWLGAVQSQDFPGAKWALSQRLGFLSNDEIQKAFDYGEILRTHVMRPTWHFVHPNDIAWMLDLTRDRVKVVMRSYNKQLGLTEEIFEKSKIIIENVLQNKNYLTRDEIAEKLKERGIKWTGNGLAHIVMWAELDGLICSGPMKGKKHTYALISERTKSSKKLEEDEALSKLVKIYFQSHGPAQIKDFVWWSGLTVEKTKRGIEANSPKLNSSEVNGKTYYHFELKDTKKTDQVFLLPNYDEYTIAYADRSDLFANVDHSKLDARQNALFNNAVIINGIGEGLWRRIFKSKTVEMEFRLFRKLNSREIEELENAIENYAMFLGLAQNSTFI